MVHESGDGELGTGNGLDHRDTDIQREKEKMTERD